MERFVDPDEMLQHRILSVALTYNHLVLIDLRENYSLEVGKGEREVEDGGDGVGGQRWIKEMVEVQLREEEGRKKGEVERREEE
eukprot:764007-Hanusia_phi.AAC.2